MSAASSTVPMATTMQGDNDITSHNDDDIPSLDDYELDASFILSKNSSKRVFDLDAMDEEHRRAIFRQIRNRIWMAVRGERSMSGWCLLKYVANKDVGPPKSDLVELARLFMDFQSQYVTLRKFEMYGQLYYLCLVPVGIMLGNYFLVGMESVGNGLI